MTLQQLQYVLAAIEHGSFSAAAEALHLAQPSLSEQVRRLEAELGVALFQRVGRGLVLTEAGRALRPHAEAALAAVERGARRRSARCASCAAALAAFGTFGTARDVPRRRPRRGLPPQPPRRARADRRPELVGDRRARSARASSRRASSSLPIDDRGLDVRPAMRDEVLYVVAPTRRACGAR